MADDNLQNLSLEELRAEMTKHVTAVAIADPLTATALVDHSKKIFDLMIEKNNRETKEIPGSDFLKVELKKLFEANPDLPVTEVAAKIDYTVNENSELFDNPSPDDDEEACRIAHAMSIAYSIIQVSGEIALDKLTPEQLSAMRLADEQLVAEQLATKNAAAQRLLGICRQYQDHLDNSKNRHGDYDLKRQYIDELIQILDNDKMNIGVRLTNFDNKFKTYSRTLSKTRDPLLLALIKGASIVLSLGILYAIKPIRNLLFTPKGATLVSEVDQTIKPIRRP